jgi:uncharacterized membrane protein
MNAVVVGGLSLVGSAALFGGHFAWAWFTDRARHTRRVLRRTRVPRIAELVDGKLACVVGTVEADGELLAAMATRRPCVASARAGPRRR